MRWRRRRRKSSAITIYWFAGLWYDRFLEFQCYPDVATGRSPPSRNNRRGRLWISRHGGFARSHSGAATVRFFGSRIVQLHAQLAGAPKNAPSTMVAPVDEEQQRIAQENQASRLS